MHSGQLFASLRRAQNGATGTTCRCECPRCCDLEPPPRGGHGRAVRAENGPGPAARQPHPKSTSLTQNQLSGSSSAIIILHPKISHKETGPCLTKRSFDTFVPCLHKQKCQSMCLGQSRFRTTQILSVFNSHSSSRAAPEPFSTSSHQENSTKPLSSAASGCAAAPSKRRPAVLSSGLWPKQLHLRGKY